MTDPTLILSIGNAGGLALQDIADHLYPTDRVQLGGISLGKPVVRSERVTWYALESDIEALRARKHEISQMPDVRDWFKSDVLRTVGDIKLDSEQRQLGRLIFYQHMMTNGQALIAYIRHLEALVRGSQANDAAPTLQVHVLASIDEFEGLAWLLDILNLLHYVLSQQASVILHCALPQTATAPHNYQTQIHLAAGYALLRELKRHVVSYGGAIQNLYPDDSPLAEWNADTVRHMASSVKFYSPIHGAITEQWADVLLALLDGEDNKLLTMYEQSRVNVPFSRSTHDDRYALMVGIYETKSAIFPRLPVQNHLLAMLTAHLLNEWVGSATDCNTIPQSELKAMVNSEWVQKRHLTADGREIQCPQVIAYALSDRYHLSEDTSLDDLFEMLNVTMLHNEQPETPTFTWGQSTTRLLSNRQQYLEQIDSHLERLFGDYSPHANGGYANALTALVEIQHEAFAESLQIFILNLLQDNPRINFRCLSRIMQQVIQPALQKLKRRVTRSVRKQTLELRHADVPQQLKMVARQLRRTKTRLNTIHEDVPRYWTNVSDILEPVKRWHAWQAVTSLVDKMEITLNLVCERIEQWTDLLWRDDSSLLTQAMQANTGFAIPQTSKTRYPFFDEGWAAEKRAEFISKYQTQLSRLFRWSIDEVGLLGLDFMADVEQASFEPLTPSPSLSGSVFSATA